MDTPMSVDDLARRWSVNGAVIRRMLRDESATLLVDHPGSFIEEELDARGWSQADLAYILGMDVSQLNKLIKGSTSVTPDTAVALGDAFDMPAEFFMNLQKMFDLQKARKADPGVRSAFCQMAGQNRLRRR